MDACAHVEVVAEAAMAERIQDALETKPDIDKCSRVEVTKTRVTVTLADGRATTRALSRREDALATVEALLLVPHEREPEPERAPEPAPVRVPAPERAPEPDPAPAVGLATAQEEHDRADGPRRSPVAVAELSVLTGARLSEDRKAAEVGILSFLDLSSWLAGVSAHLEYAEHVEGGPPDTSFHLALLGGKRFRGKSLDFDVYGGPGVAFCGTTHSDEVFQEPKGTRHVIKDSSNEGARLALGTRLTFKTDSIVRGFVGLDGHVGETSDGTLPLWSAGLSVGATVGSR